MAPENTSGLGGARRARKAELRRRLSSAPEAWLRGVLDNPEVGPAELILLLRNHAAPIELLERIGAHPGWMAHHEVCRALARHARTPLALARNLLPLLYWKDWIDLAAQPSANPVVRRQAERMLLARLDDLSLGQRIALARRATRGLIHGFLKETDPRALEALLDNPRLVELDAVRLAENPVAGAYALDRIAEHPVWGRRRAVCLQLLRRAELAIQTSLRLAHRLEPRDLQVLVEDDRVPLVVRVGIERRLRGKPRKWS